MYNQAAHEMAEKQRHFMADYEKNLQRKLQQVKAGELPQKSFEAWKQSQAYAQSWYSRMVEELALDAVRADKRAAAMVNEQLPYVYAENANYGTYQVESAAKIDTNYTMYDQSTVQRLVRDNPSMYAQASVNVAKDYAWNQQKLASAITQGILQGEPIEKVAKRIQSVAAMDYRAAVRTARTMMTGAQNAGRIDSYRRAESMGVQGMKRWLATLDSHTRHSHAAMDGETVETKEAFSNNLEYPGDTSGDPSEYMNCRCTLQYEFEGVDYGNAERFSRLEDMTYEEWKEYHAIEWEKKKAKRVNQ